MRMPRSTWIKRTQGPALLGILLFVAGMTACNKEDEKRRYCDQSGCFECVGERCYPVPGDPTLPGQGQVSTCDNDSSCGAGRVCNLGRCEAACAEDANCKSGNTCIAGRCRPTGSASCGVVGALCTEDSQCGEGRGCVARACAARCDGGQAKCALGQVCLNGACVEDPAPVMAQCVFDADCGQGKGGFRCVNAYCLPACADAKACGEGAACVKGLCRADRRSI